MNFSQETRQLRFMEVSGTFPPFPSPFSAPPPPSHISLFSANSTDYKIELPKDIISVRTSCIKVIPVVRSPEPKANFLKCNFQNMKMTVHSFDALCIILYRSLTAIICVLLLQVLYCYRYVICYFTGSTKFYCYFANAQHVLF